MDGGGMKKWMDGGIDGYRDRWFALCSVTTKVVIKIIKIPLKCRLIKIIKKCQYK